MHSEQVAALNKIIALIDTKATDYKHDFMRLSTAQRVAGKKLILDLVADAEQLGTAIKPQPTEVLDDLRRLVGELNRLG
ncbi:MAG: hypothetical protein JSR44_01920 [Spirochaetes bacterium]|nr:hypothetical protein [Spirochaetota bacterium]